MKLQFLRFIFYTVSHNFKITFPLDIQFCYVVPKGSRNSNDMREPIVVLTPSARWINRPSSVGDVTAV